MSARYPQDGPKPKRLQGWVCAYCRAVSLEFKNTRPERCPDCGSTYWDAPPVNVYRHTLESFTANRQIDMKGPGPKKA